MQSVKDLTGFSNYALIMSVLEQWGIAVSTGTEWKFTWNLQLFDRRFSYSVKEITRIFQCDKPIRWLQGNESQIGINVGFSKIHEESWNVSYKFLPKKSFCEL